MPTSLSWAPATITEAKGFGKNLSPIGLWLFHLKWVSLDQFEAFDVDSEVIKYSKRKFYMLE